MKFRLVFTGAYSAFQSIPSHPSLVHKGSNDSDMFCPVPLGLSIPRSWPSVSGIFQAWVMNRKITDIWDRPALILKVQNRTNDNKGFWANYAKLRTDKMHQLLVWLVCSWTKIDIGFKAQNIFHGICVLTLYNNITLTSALAPAWVIIL